MDKYKDYKEVRMGWLGRIPAHWTTVPLKYSIGKSPSSFVDGDWIESKVIKSEGIRYLTTGNVGVINYKEQGNGFISDKTFRELNCTEVFPGDVLISRLNFPIGRSCIVPDLGYRIVVAVDNVIFRPDETKYNKKFLVYQMNCYPYSENANFIARGSTMQRITRTQLGALKLCVPPLEEQNAMVSYLDKKCSEIDNVISAQQKRIALLQELKQSVITHAVTKGLNPNVEMKDSGMEWIGNIPSNWNNLRLRFVCELRNGYTPSKANPEFWEDGIIPWYRMEDIRESGRKLKEAKQYITEDAVKGGGLFEAGSFILATTATIGEHAVLIVDSLANQQFTNLKIRKSLSQKLLGDFFFYYLYMVDDYCKATTKTSTFPAVSMELLKNCHIVFPSVQEQYKIIDYLDKRCASIDSSITKAQHQVELLQEYKQSLITEVVTGKRKVC